MEGYKWSPAYSGDITITPTFMQPTSASQSPQKRRRTDSVPINGNGLNVGPQHPQQFIQHEMSHTQMDAQHNITPVPSQPAHIPKRGARACTACRKGKNRCEGEPPCRRCQINGTPCIFEKPEKKNVQASPTPGVDRLNRLEGQYLVMQSHMIGMQTTLDRILATVSGGPPHPFTYPPVLPQGHVAQPSPGVEFGQRPPSTRSQFLPAPGFAAPPHNYSVYGIVPSNIHSDGENDSEDALSRSPIEPLQGLANAAVEAANSPELSSRRVRKEAEPAPRDTFPHVVEKGLVSETEARELHHIFFSGCHLFIPIFDPSYDTFESLMERTPWTFDSILAVAAKIRSGNGPLSPTFYKCLEEAQNIARSSLFGPIVRKEAVQGMLLLAAWSANGWLPSGHAMRMALDLGLNRALERLADSSDHGQRYTEDEQRDLVVSARIWLCLYWFDHQMSLGTGRPIVLRDENCVRLSRILLSHPMTSPADVRLVSLVELVAQKTQIYETLATLSGPLNHSSLAVIRRANAALGNWYKECDELHGKTMDEESLPRIILAGELHYAKLWLVCVALRGVSWDKMPFEQRELAFQGRDAASNCLSNLLNSPIYRAALRYAVHDGLVPAAFSALFLLKMANLFPADCDLGSIAAQTEQLAQLLTDVAAERYAVTLRIVLATIRRKIRLPTGDDDSDDGSRPTPNAQPLPGSSTQASEEELEFSSGLPVWIQEQNLTDLGLPVDGYDSVFVKLGNPNGWSGAFPQMPEAR
ncbi:hypothetical protein BJ322DRAFT_1155023 [Thelephora terrestris]|uniref:Zn(2)-C6 fungal-type domain-containing protein n=1 Tax=Thelephora terrestris TaxID=56493 RepID=A0A9P6HS05_9AGAM|nr:hypothetical protein BJ322DRAFT_1155023 [Thelephora terrestris]